MLQGNLHRRCEIKVWAYLDECMVFTCKKTVVAPTDYSVCLVNNNGQKQYFACNSQKLLTYWMCAMRLSKVSF